MYLQTVRYRVYFNFQTSCIEQVDEMESQVREGKSMCVLLSLSFPNSK